MTTTSARTKAFLSQVLPPPAAEALAAGAGLGGAEAMGSRYDDEDANAALAKIGTAEEMTPAQQFAAEAIIIPDHRPAIAIANGDYEVTQADWLELNRGQAKARIKAAIPAVGRVELPKHPSLPYGGTGFVVGGGLMMTNRHVAEIFTQGLGMGPLAFRSGQTAAVDLKREVTSTAPHLLEVRDVLMIHPFWDMALLRVAGLPSSIAPLSLALATPEDMAGQPDVAVIGYPAFDPRNDPEVQRRVFGGLYNVKRLQPGKLRGRETIESFGHDVSAVTHDASTLGGASGSAVVHVASGEIAALHFAGVYLKANYGVPGMELARDARVVDAGVKFAGEPKPDSAAKAWWTGFDAERSPAAAGPAPALVTGGDGSVTFTAPLEITIRLGAPVQAAAVTPAVEAMVEPFHDPDLADRQGYAQAFLGAELPLPELKDESLAAPVDGGGHILTYSHHSIVMHRRRRLALFAASNIDTSQDLRRPEPGRDYTRKGLTGLGKNDQEKWFLDERISEAHQLPDRFFTKDKGAFDKGHIVRREDVAWGSTYDAVRVANGDTYYVTNCSPQVAGFNRSANGVENWGDLENYVLKQAGSERLSLFSGPVLADDDPFFLGVDDQGHVRIQIPRAFWKVVVAAKDGQLQSFGFLLEQDLSGVPLEFVVDAVWRAHLKPIAELEAKLQVRFPDAVRAGDQAGQPAGEAVRMSAGLI
ncbi:MAG: hypothetical protein GC203_14715 [Phenylobacterium sp.]|uniref:DNA/RNA non-specific endonuclease n=1 Tax=Phenylobacterium sp. TaxID=1871053 RepID=UPI0025D9A1E3|nr:DNA/RNA non-specific endonuclease [Phenylobacterium sp.]MBI1199109.1 hypothetical protein [Phenylobacterium sp.]